MYYSYIGEAWTLNLQIFTKFTGNREVNDLQKSIQTINSWKEDIKGIAGEFQQGV